MNWNDYLKSGLDDLMQFNEGYKTFLTNCKTEREAVKQSIKIAEANGFKNLRDYISEGKKLEVNDKVYITNMDKNVLLFVIGKETLDKGINVLGAHIDSPRIDVKQKPLYEDTDLVLLDTHYYGGIKKYQWVARPLALHGVICKKDGTRVDVVIGEDENDPVIGISDLLIHLSQDQLKKPGSNVVEGEDLNALVGSIPALDEEKEPVKKAILNLLKEKYGMEEDDFISSEFELVPQGKSRDYGFDRSMVLGYGHDDRVCAYTSLMAIVEMQDLDKTACCILVDKEEVGSIGATGMQSRFFENALLELLNLQGLGSEIYLRRCEENSCVLSSDVSAGFDPNYPQVNEPKNTAYFGKGICINKYTGSRGKGGCNDANPEYIARIRRIFDEDQISFQTGELGKVDQGGGGTIAYILANLNMNVIDAGIAVQNMHAPCEIVSKIDVYEAYRAYKTFLRKI